MTELERYLNQSFLGNELRDFAWFAGILGVGLLLKRVFSVLISRLLYHFVRGEEEKVPVTEFIRLLRVPFENFTLLLFLYLAFDRLRFPVEWNLAPVSAFGLRQVIAKGYQILLILSVTWILLRFIDFFAREFTRKAAVAESPLDNQFVPFFKELVKVLMVIFSLFFILGVVFHLNVASLVAGLGIGGLAVALAAKESLENLFASFTIFFDRPFVAGDAIQVGAISGTVEKVGFRSTRIRTFDKSFLTVPNKMLIDQALDNLTQRRLRRARFTIGLTLDTPAETLKAVAADIRAALDEHPGTRTEPGVVRFDEFGTSSLNLLVLFFVETADWGEYMAVKEEINYRIIEIVHHHRAAFAFPTTTLHWPGPAAGTGGQPFKPFSRNSVNAP
ncbi:MAG: mechanosensitive ion channel family protein [Ferruginibacter sp.]|nr:mechanosensitive ion channel family protein [Cytophagales bacterium]